MYKIIDVNNCIDMQTGEYEAEARTRLASGFEGDRVDKGHCTQWVFNTDKISLIRVSQAAGLDTSPFPGYVYHDKHVEVEYILSGTCDLKYPDQTVHKIKTGDCLCHAPNQPHRMLATGRENMKLSVVLNGQLDTLSRSKWEADKYLHIDGGYSINHCQDIPSLEGTDPLLDVKLVYEADNLCFADVRMLPGCSVPATHFISNANSDQIILVVSGTGTAIYPDKAYPLYTDVAAYNYAGQAYKYINTGNNVLHLLVYFSVSRFKDLERKEVKLNDTI